MSRKIIVWGFVVAVVGLIVLGGIRMTSELKEKFIEMAKAPPMTSVITARDSAVINKKYLPRLQPSVNINSNKRSSVSFFYVDSLYSLTLFEIDHAADKPLSALLEISDTVFERSSYGWYAKNGNSDFSAFQWTDATPNPVNKLYVGISGDSLSTVVKNDSVVEWHGVISGFSVRYGQHRVADICMQREGFPLTRLKMPAEILFLRRNRGT